MPSSEALNLKVIVEAIDQHDGSCDYPLLCIFMAPFEIERLGWDEIQGVPLQPDPDMQTGRFRLYCEGMNLDQEDVVEAVADEPLVTA